MIFCFIGFLVKSKTTTGKNGKIERKRPGIRTNILKSGKRYFYRKEIDIITRWVPPGFKSVELENVLEQRKK